MASLDEAAPAETNQGREGFEVELPLERVRPDPKQPRSQITDESLQGLLETIQSGELYQPIIVRPHPNEKGNYLIVAGHRRYRAHELAEKETIRARVRELDEKEAFLVSLIENLQREQLSPFDEAAGYDRMMELFGINQQQVAERVRKPSSVISETRKLAKLPDTIKQEYADFPVAKSVLLLIGRERSAKKQLAMWEELKLLESEDRTVDTARALSEALERGSKTAGQGAPVNEVHKDLGYISTAASSLTGRLGRIPFQHFQENPRQHRQLYDLYTSLGRLIERLGEPPPPEVAAKRKPGRKKQGAAQEALSPTEPEAPA